MVVVERKGGAHRDWKLSLLVGLVAVTPPALLRKSRPTSA